MRAKLGIALAGSLGIVLILAGPAAAHAGFVSSTPEPRSVLSVAPGVVVLEFSEPVNPDLSRATVTSPDGSAAEGTVTGDSQVTISLATNAQGVYQVSWTTVSTVDGHTLSGSFGFGVGISPGPGSAGQTQDEPRSGDLLVVIARVVEDAALLLSVGLLLLGRLARRPPALTWVRARPTAVLAVAAAAGSVVVVGEALLAAPSPSLDAIAIYLTSGTPGIARLVRPGIELLALLAASFRPRLLAWPLVAALGALAAAGHAAAISPRWWGIAVETIHLVSAGLWAGGIMGLAAQHPPTGWRDGSGRDLLGRFTPVALPAFAVTAGTGILRGFQETGGFAGLFGSSYGVVLLVKVFLVLVLVQLSLLAWRRILVRPRVESIVAVTVLGAAALLAAFPLPPARLSEAETLRAGASGEVQALPRRGELSLGSNAGEFLVGLTVRSSEDELVIYLLGLEGPDDDATRVVTVDIDGRSLPVSQCGPSCRSVSVSVLGGEHVTVAVGGPSGGEAPFVIPDPLASPAGDLLERMTAEMHSLPSFRLTETLNSGRAELRSEYEIRAPDSLRVRNVQEDGGGSEVVWIGDTRYLRELPDGPWQVDSGSEAQVPVYVWDSFEPFIGAHAVGRETIRGAETTVVTFFGGDEQLPAWFRLWIDPSGIVHRAEMDAPGHFMDQRYYDFGSRITIEAPDLK